MLHPQLSALLERAAQSPLLAKSLAKLPPAFVMTAGFDPLRDEGKAYADRLAKEGVKTEYKNYADMVHGFITMGRVIDTANMALADCAQALREDWKNRGQSPILK